MTQTSHTKVFVALAITFGLTACNNGASTADALACLDMMNGGIRPIATDRSRRFLGKVDEATARCRGGEKAVAWRDTPWLDWSNYWATGDASSKEQGGKAVTRLGEHIRPNGRGIDGALMDFEYQRIELIKFNLFDNYSYETYVTGRGSVPGPLVKKWPAMRLQPDKARLVVAALIAKIHTIEWTPQLLYDEPLYKAMNANWFGLFDQDRGDASRVLRRILNRGDSFVGRTMAQVAGWLGMHGKSEAANAAYSVLASGAGIIGLGNRHMQGWLWWKHDAWDVTNPDDLMRGVNHFGSPFNFLRGLRLRLSTAPDAAGSA